MDPAVRLAEDVAALFRPQRQWVEGRGLWLMVAFFFSAVGAGTWLVSTPLVFDVPAGLVIAFVCLLGASGGTHLLFLGKPLRVWRMVLQVGTSWVSRGLVGILVFSVSAVLYLLPAFVAMPWTQEGVFGQIMLVLTILSALLVATYKGFVFAVAKGIPFWNSPILVPLFIASALRGGLAVLLLIGSVGGIVTTLHAVEVAKLWTVISGAALILFYIWVMNDADVAARYSARKLLWGKVSLPFYLGVVAVGMVVPVVGGSLSFFTQLPGGVLALVGASSLIGDFYITYTIAKAGVYVPLVLGALPQQG